MPTPLASIALRADAWAEVRANGRAMRYRRSGAGRSVLLLRTRDGDAPLWPELVDALSTAFRVIDPEIPKRGIDAVAWLADFLDGLGVARLDVVATGRFCSAAVALTLLDGDRVGHVVLVPEDDTEDAGLHAVPATPTPEAPVPLLVVRRGLAAADALSRVTRFLTDDRSSPVA
jgi:nicotinamidase-related amidase